MDFFTNKKTILKVVGFMLVFQATLFAGTSQVEESLQLNSGSGENKTERVTEKVEVAFDNTSIVLMLALTSLLGSFFLKDELEKSF